MIMIVYGLKQILTIFFCHFDHLWLFFSSSFCPFFEHFHYTAGRFYFKDTHSCNGSWVNGQKVEAGQERVLSNGDIIKLADDMVDCGDMQKIFAKILLTYPHVEDSVIPSSLEPVEFGLDKTGSWDDLLQLNSSTRPRPTTSQPALTRFTLPNRRQKSLALARLKQCKWLDTNMV